LSKTNIIPCYNFYRTSIKIAILETKDDFYYYCGGSGAKIYDAKLMP